MRKRILLIITVLAFILPNSLRAQDLPVNWNFNVKKLNDSIAELQFNAKIKEKWHLFALVHKGMEMPLVIEFKPSPQYQLVGKINEPKPIVSYDPVFKDTSKYHEKTAQFKQRIKVKTNTPFELKGELSGQACIDGKCVAIDRDFIFKVSGFENLIVSVTDESSVTDNTVADENAQVQADTTSEQSFTPVEREKEEEESLWLFFLVAVAGGFAGLLMPCVFPMIPMTVSYFLKMEKNLNFMLWFSELLLW